MKITMEIKDLIVELRKAFPEMDEIKLKAAMLDLVLGNEVSVERPARQESESVTESSEPELPPASFGTAGTSNQDVASKWADMAQSVVPVGTAEDAFEEDAEEVTPTMPEPRKRGRPPKKDQAAKDAARKQKRQEIDQFNGMDDKEIAQFLTQQNQRQSKNGQFVDLGGDTGSDDMAIG